MAMEVKDGSAELGLLRSLHADMGALPEGVEQAQAAISDILQRRAKLIEQRVQNLMQDQRDEYVKKIEDLSVRLDETTAERDGALEAAARAAEQASSRQQGSEESHKQAQVRFFHATFALHSPLPPP